MKKICMIILIGFFVGCENKKTEADDPENETITKSQQKTIHMDMSDSEKNSVRIVRKKEKLDRQEFFVDIAYKAIKGIELPEEVEPEVENLGEITIVSWPIKQEDTTKQGFIVLTGDYHAKVKIDSATNEVLEVLVAP